MTVAERLAHNSDPARIRVICDQHRKPYVVADYVRTPSGWELRMIVQCGPPRLKLSGEVDLSVDGNAPVDWESLTHPPNSRANFTWPDSESTGKHRMVLENRCPRCRANFPVRKEKLDALMTAVHNAGRSKVTLRELAAITRVIDARHDRSGRPC